MMVVVPQIDEEGISATLEKVNQYVSERGGSVVRQERWGRLRRLAYPIKNYNEGNYVLTHLEMEPQDAKDLEANLILSEDVLRHLLVNVETIPEAKVEQPQATTAAAETTETASPEPSQVEEGVVQETSVVVATDEPATPVEDQVAAVEDEPPTPVEDQVVAVEDEPATPVEDQVGAVEDEPTETTPSGQEPPEKKEEGS